MQIGCLGDIIFEVSDNLIKTIRKAELSGSASIQTHARHLDTAIVEFVGSSAETFSFNMRISQFLGVDPLKEIEAIKDYSKNGKSMRFTIGKKTFGYKWLIQKYKITFENYAKDGTLIDADVSLSLIEYQKE